MMDSYHIIFIISGNLKFQIYHLFYYHSTRENYYFNIEDTLQELVRCCNERYYLVTKFTHLSLYLKAINTMIDETYYKNRVKNNSKILHIGAKIVICDEIDVNEDFYLRVKKKF